MTSPTARSGKDDAAVIRLATPAGGGYLEQLRVASLSAGRFTAAPGYDERQEPHDEDEIYYIIDGEAVLEIDGVPHRVTAGTLAYVPRGAQHRFTQVSADLDVLVVFASA